MAEEREASSVVGGADFLSTSVFYNKDGSVHYVGGLVSKNLDKGKGVVTGVATGEDYTSDFQEDVGEADGSNYEEEGS